MNQWYFSGLYPNFLGLNGHMSKCLARSIAVVQTVKTVQKYLLHFQHDVQNGLTHRKENYSKYHFVRLILHEFVTRYFQLMFVAFMVHD